MHAHSESRQMMGRKRRRECPEIGQALHQQRSQTLTNRRQGPTDRPSAPSRRGGAASEPRSPESGRQRLSAPPLPNPAKDNPAKKRPDGGGGGLLSVLSARTCLRPSSPGEGHSARDRESSKGPSCLTTRGRGSVVVTTAPRRVTKPAVVRLSLRRRRERRGLRTAPREEFGRASSGPPPPSPPSSRLHSVTFPPPPPPSAPSDGGAAGALLGNLFPAVSAMPKGAASSPPSAQSVEAAGPGLSFALPQSILLFFDSLFFSLWVSLPNSVFISPCIFCPFLFSLYSRFVLFPYPSPLSGLYYLCALLRLSISGAATRNNTHILPRNRARHLPAGAVMFIVREFGRPSEWLSDPDNNTMKSLSIALEERECNSASVSFAKHDN
ncbi:hypothetical protein C7M84_012717 [Penaeus vannamei]|uniref:Uncharacterized protein n=1 Tax=Penaeus vannamei TaxID=6689 RepID=A0A423SY52_PENVA|nr:hypothetical protein C7M84_012717 [Penaeus vannamei]